MTDVLNISSKRRSMRRSGHIRERSPGLFELRYSLGTDPRPASTKSPLTLCRQRSGGKTNESRRPVMANFVGRYGPKLPTGCSLWQGSLREVCDEPTRSRRRRH
jgi:hypothetical protein